MSSVKKTARKSVRRVVQPHKAALQSRLRRIEGQVRGVAKMVDENRYCVDILTQIAALRSALDAVALRLLEDHARGCVTQSVKQGDKHAIDELLTVVKHFTR